jgi:hypothetical protein
LGYSDLQNVWSSHTKFERLQALAIMHDVATAIKDYQDRVQLPPASGQKKLDFSDLGAIPVRTAPDYDALAKQAGAIPAAQRPDFIPERPAARKPQDQNIVYLDDQGNPIASGKAQHEGATGGAVTLDFSKAQPISPERGFFPVFEARKADVSDKVADPAAEITVDVNNLEDIKTVNADKTGAISSVQLTSGEWVAREPKTFRARFALIARLLFPFCYPVIGFLVPWGSNDAAGITV